MHSWKVRRIPLYYVPNKLLSSEKTAHHLTLFFLFNDENQLFSSCSPFYQNKMQERGVQDVANRNKIKFEPCGDVVDQAFSQFNENSINNPDPQSQIENNQTPEADYPNENDSKDTETNKISAIPNFV